MTTSPSEFRLLFDTVPSTAKQIQTNIQEPDQPTTKDIHWTTWQGHKMVTTVPCRDIGQYNGGGRLEHPVASVTGNSEYRKNLANDGLAK